MMFAWMGMTVPILSMVALEMIALMEKVLFQDLEGRISFSDLLVMMISVPLYHHSILSDGQQDKIDCGTGI